MKHQFLPAKISHIKERILWLIFHSRLGDFSCDFTIAGSSILWDRRLIFHNVKFEISVFLLFNFYWVLRNSMEDSSDVIRIPWDSSSDLTTRRCVFLSFLKFTTEIPATFPAEFIGFLRNSDCNCVLLFTIYIYFPTSFPNWASLVQLVIYFNVMLFKYNNYLYCWNNALFIDDGIFHRWKIHSPKLNSVCSLEWLFKLPKAQVLSVMKMKEGRERTKLINSVKEFLVCLQSSRVCLNFTHFGH